MGPETALRARVACVGIHILDVLGRPIDVLPTIQLSLIIDEIRMTVAGTAGGTAIDLARMGLEVRTVGAIGDDNAGKFVRMLLESEGVDTTMLVTKPGAATSATMLPVNSAGVRPAWHQPGTNRLLDESDLRIDELLEVDALHYGGVSALPGLDGEPAARLLRMARERGVLTTADCLGVKSDDAFEQLRLSLPHIDVFMPNQAEAMALTGTDDPEGAALMLREVGANAVIVKLDADGCLVVSSEETFRLPAITVDVVDSTGCGDAFCSGVIRGLLAGHSLRESARLGAAAGALTAMGLGSDAGIQSYAATAAFMDSRVQEHT